MIEEFFGFVDRNIYNHYLAPLELKKGLHCDDIDRSYAPGLVLDDESWFIVPTAESITKVNQPLKDFDLLKEFANTERTPEIFLQFANRFGPLNPLLNTPESGTATYTQSVMLWQYMHQNICDALDLLEIIDSGTEEIATWSIFRIEARGETIYSGPGGVLALKNQEIDKIIAEDFEGTKENLFLSYAKIFLRHIIKIHMSQFHVFPIPTIRKGKIEPYFISDSGFAILWYMIYQAATGKNKYARCSICGEWENITDVGRRKWERHPKCYNRQNSIRNSKISRARKLLIKGLSIEEIAAKVSESPETLSIWLVKNKEAASAWQGRKDGLKEDDDYNKRPFSAKKRINTIDP